MLLGLLLFCLLRSNKVEKNWEAEADNADARENCTLDVQSNVTKDQRHDGEVSVGEGSGGEAHESKDWHAQCRQEGDEQAVDKGASNAALDAALCVTKDTCGCAAEEVRNNAWEDQGNSCNLGINDTKDKQTQDAANERAQEADDNGVWSIGECDWAVDCRLCTRDKLLSNTLECRNNLAND